MLKLCLYHRNVLNLYFWEENNKFNVHILRNVHKYKSFSVNLDSVITRHYKMYTKYDFYLNLKFCQVFNNIVSSENVIQFLLHLDLFSDEKYDIEKKDHLFWKIANIVAFSSKRPYATKYSTLQDLHCTQNFASTTSVFYKISFIKLFFLNLCIILIIL